MRLYRIRRLGIATLMVGALAVELAACGSGSTSSASSSGNHGSTPTVTVGLAVPTSDYAPLYLGVDKGLFKKAGLNVKLVTFHGGSDVVKGVASGSADIGVTALAGVLSAVQQNQPLKVFYGGFNMTEFQWYASDGITSVQQAKGKSWGVTKIGSSTDFLTRYLAKQHGLKPKTDIKIVQSGGSAARLAAQKAGQIQVNIFAPPETFEAQKLGYHRIAKQSDLMDGYPFHVEFANQSFIKQNPMTVKKFLRGLVMGMKLTHSNPKAAQRSFVHHVKIDPKYASRTYQSWINGIEADGSLPSAKAMDVFWKIGIENGQFDHRIPKSKWLDTKWINSYPQWTQ